MKTDAEWKDILTPDQYRVLREKGTERPFSGEYANSHETGTYVCAACGNELFSSKTKYDSGTGWPSFWEPVGSESVETEEDRSLWMTRTEVRCRRCGSPLGHLAGEASDCAAIQCAHLGIAQERQHVAPQ